MTTLTKLLPQAEESKVPRQNVINCKDLQKAIIHWADICAHTRKKIIKYKEIIFGVDSPICIECLKELQKQQVIDDIVYRNKLLEDTLRKLA